DATAAAGGRLGHAPRRAVDRIPFDGAVDNGELVVVVDAATPAVVGPVRIADPVRRDHAVDDRQRADVLDTAATDLGGGVVSDGTVADGQRAGVVDAAAVVSVSEREGQARNRGRDAAVDGEDAEGGGAGGVVSLDRECRGPGAVDAHIGVQVRQG